MGLMQQIDYLKVKSSARMPEEIKNIMEEATEKLLNQEIEKNALKTGDQLPEFKLKNAIGDTINIYELLSKGPLIIIFYRGAWCPYCNLELRAYQELLPRIREVGADLVAISPETPDLSLSLSEKLSIDFEVLSDINNKVARQLGLVFKLDDKLISLYKNMGIDLAESQGNADGELPVPATYVVGSDGEILLAYVNSDYTKRLEPEDALAAITNNKVSGGL
ncbi:MAG: peroxiredoxin-like family protein [Bacillota bacterium]|nr:peroxiredoxin-like family protein [Bacillota bacterium]